MIELPNPNVTFIYVSIIENLCIKYWRTASVENPKETISYV